MKIIVTAISIVLADDIKLAISCKCIGLHNDDYFRVPYKYEADTIWNGGQNGRHFADDIFRCIFVNEKFCTLI